MEKNIDEKSLESINHVLREMLFFEEFTEEELVFFSRHVSLRYFPEKTTLFKKGDIGDYLFFIVEGAVDIKIEPADTKSIIIASFERGACVGEMSIVDDYPRSATVLVTQPSELLLLTRNRFELICKEEPQVGIKFLRGLSKNLSIRLRKTTGRFADIA